MIPIIDTDRLIVRQFKPEDEAIYLNLCEDERVTLHLPYRTREEQTVIFRESLLDPPGQLIGRWGMFNKADGDFIGTCLLRAFDDDTDSIELGYVLGYKYWGMGIATEMAGLLLAYARNINADAKFVAVTTLENNASQHVLEKVGLHRVGNYIRQGKDLAFFKSHP